jgi:hypothetical protein
MIVLLTDGEAQRWDTLGNGFYNRAKGEPINEAQWMPLTVKEFAATCEIIRQQGKIRVYTIGFALSAPMDSRRVDAQNALQSCYSNGGRHFDAESGHLQEAFKQLIGDINVIRLIE